MGKNTFLVSGARGFIGKHLVGGLRFNGDQVFEVPKPGPELDELLPQLQDLDLTNAIFVANGWSGVTTDQKNHQGAQNESLQNFKLQTMALNRIGVRRIMGFGSQAEYSAEIPDSNEAPSAYAQSKTLAHDWLRQLHLADPTVEFVWLRLFSIYGPGMDPSWLLPTLKRAITSGHELKLGACTQVWSFLHVNDLVKLVLNLASQPLPCIAVDVANPEQIPLRELLMSVAGTYNQENLLVFGEKESAYTSVADLTYAISCGWRPKIQLIEGFKEI